MIVMESGRPNTLIGNYNTTQHAGIDYTKKDKYLINISR